MYNSSNLSIYLQPLEQENKCFGSLARYVFISEKFNIQFKYTNKYSYEDNCNWYLYL